MKVSLSIENIGCIFVGMALLLFGVYRACPVEVNKKFLLQSVPLLVMAGIMVAFAFHLGGMKWITTGVKDSLKVTGSFLPMIAGLFVVLGFSDIISRHYNDGIKEMLSGKFGYFGVFVSSFAAPSANALAKFVESLWHEQSLRPQLLYCLTVTPLLSWNIFLIRQMGLGTEIALQMYKANALAAIGLMPVFWMWGKMIAR